MHFVATVAPLTKKARFLRKLCALTTIESYSTVAIFYLVIIGVMTIIFSVAEKKIKIPGLTIEKAKK